MPSGNELITHILAASDYDGDGNVDVVLAGKVGSDYVFALYKNKGDATFEELVGAFPIAGTIKNITVLAGDYNGDGKPDLLFNAELIERGDNPSSGTSGIYKNNGDGTFALLPFPATNGTYTGDVAWIDYDKDGKPDAIVTGQRWHTEVNGGWDWWTLFLYHNDGDDAFTLVTENTGLGGTCEGGIAVGDINKDGYEDFVMTGQSTYGVFYNTPDSANLFTKNPSTFIKLEAGQITQGSVALVDVDNDNDLDLVVMGGQRTPVLGLNKFPASDDGTILLPPLPEPAEVTKVTFEELTLTSSFPVNLQNGAGQIWGDYNNDGKLDVFIWGLYDNDGAPLSRLYRNDGAGAFTNVTSAILGGSFPGLVRASAAWIDYNNDERLDLIISGATSVSGDNLSNFVTKVYQNLGAAASYQLSEEPTIALPAFDTEKKGGIARNIIAADFDLDGYQDLLVCLRYTDVDLDGTERRFEIYRNAQGLGFVMLDNTGLPAANGGGIALGDYDRDGDMDILFSGYRDDISGGYRTGVYTNNGDATFTETFFSIEGADYNHPADGLKPFNGYETGESLWFDYDGDGYLDALVTGSGNTYPFDDALHKYKDWGWNWWSASLFRYDPATKTFGNARPSEMELGLTGTCEGGATTADFNNDGRADLLVAGQSTNALFYGTSNGVFSSESLGADFTQGNASTVDFDNDGKLDIFAVGKEGTKLFHNTSNITPAAPAAPTDLTATPGADGEITVSWAASPIPTMRYNVWLSKPETQYKNFVISLIPVDAATGAPKLSLDHAPLLSTTTYSLKGIPGGEYSIGVQAIGINGKASALTTTTATVAGGSPTAAPKQALGNVAAYKHGSAIVVTTDIAAEAELTVYNLNGLKVWSKTGVFAGNTEINGLQQDAIYLVVVRVGKAQEVRKVLL
jgi:hypothetical protein